MNNRRLITLTAGLPCLLALHISHAASRPPAIAVPYVASTPAIDAAPDNPGWATASVIPALPVCLGNEGKDLAPSPTQVKVVWSDEALAVRFVCADDTVYTPVRGHDAPIWKGDVVEVFLDVKGDARQWIELEVNPNGDTFDQLTTLTAEPKTDDDGILVSSVLQRDYWPNPSWELAGWRTAASRTGTGWIVDMAIPASALRRLGHDRYSPSTLRANFMRYKYLPSPAGAPRRLLAMGWAPVKYGCPHISPKRMGYVELAPAGK